MPTGGVSSGKFCYHYTNGASQSCFQNPSQLTVPLALPVAALPTQHVRLLVANCADERGQTGRHTDRKIDKLTDRQTGRET